ncbi:MAG: hypothetical protein AAB367_03605 [Patescibacteria group bacterium]
MYPGEFESLFRKVANTFTLDSVAEEKTVSGKFPKRNASSPLWDTIDSGWKSAFIDLGGRRVVSTKHFLKKPVRILFFILLVEMEGRIFRIHEWQGKDIEELNEKNLNHLIKELVDSDLIKLQSVYKTRSALKEDLKAISAFRNLIVHVNKKLQREINLPVVAQRKQQLINLLRALQEIIDNME